MAQPTTRYQSEDEDSGRWAQVPLRPDDIIISTRSKSGTTWMQMICALLVFRTPELPKPLSELSPWVDWLVNPIEEVVASLQAQTHRRFMKTHTPLDGIPLDDRVHYIVVARHPLDMAVSLFHQGNNLDRQRLAELTGSAEDGPAQGGPAEREPAQAGPQLEQWLRSWIDWDGPHGDRLDSLPGVLWHMGGAWDRRHQANMHLVHFDDLLADLDTNMSELAAGLSIEITADEIASLSASATFDGMRSRSKLVAPDPQGVLKSTDAFFRRGSSGAGAETLDPDDLARYEQRVRQMIPEELFDWLHR